MDPEKSPVADPDPISSPEAIVQSAIKEGHVDKRILEHSHDADEALKAFAGREGQVIEIDEETNRRLLRKIDWNLIPIMCVVYGLNYLDKTTLSYSSVMGLKKSIHIDSSQYSWLGSMFYFGYLGWEYPTNRLLQRLPLGKYSAANVMAWGLVLSCFAGVKNFGGAVVIRFLLGVTEAAVTPGFALLTSQWYTKTEQGTRTGIWFSFNGWAQLFGGFLAYGIQKGVDKHGSSIESWKIIFLVTGLLTFCMGVLFWFIVPDNQMNARWLTPEERILAIERIRVNQQGVGNKHWKWYQFKETLMDPITWCFFFYALIADIPNGGISNFFSLLIESFGYTAEQSLIWGTPGGACEVVSLIAGGYFGDRYNNRILCGALGLTMSIIGMGMIVGISPDNPKGRITGYYFTQFSATPFVALLSLLSTNIAGYTKKTTIAAIYLIGYCAGNIIGPQTFRGTDYRPAEITILVCWCACLVLLATIYTIFRVRNSRKAKLRAAPDYVKLQNQEFLDLTDLENPEFVYRL